MKTLELVNDANGRTMDLVALSDPHDVNGTGASAVSNAIDGKVVRISAISADLRFLIGLNPVALSTSHFLGDHKEIWMPITPGHKVAVIGGIANIGTAGA